MITTNFTNYKKVLTSNGGHFFRHSLLGLGTCRSPIIKTTNFTNYKKVLTSNGGHLFFATRSWGSLATCQLSKPLISLIIKRCSPAMVGIFFATRSWGSALASGPRLAPGSWLRLALFLRRRCGAIPDNTHAWLPSSLLSSLFSFLFFLFFLFFSLPSLFLFFFSFSPFSSFLSTHWGLLVYCAALPALGGEILLFGQKMALLLACEIKNCYFCGYGR